jgi:hypothetical protein
MLPACRTDGEGAYSTDFYHPVHGKVAMQSMGRLPPSPEDFGLLATLCDVVGVGHNAGYLIGEAQVRASTN